MSQNIIAVNFNNQSLFATLIDSVPYVAMKPICENIGLNWDSQRQRIQRHPILSKGTVMITAPSNGGLQEMLMLPLKMLNGWLFGVDSTRVKPEIKDAVIKYQEECFDVLANHFMPKRNALVEIAPTYACGKMQRHVSEMVNAHARKVGKHHNTIYDTVKTKFEFPRMEALPVTKYLPICDYFGVKPKYKMPAFVTLPVDELESLRALPNPKARFQIIPQKDGGLLKFVGEDGDDKTKYAMIPIEKWEDLSQAGSFATDEKLVQVKSGQVMKMDDFVEQVFQDPRHPYVMVKRDVMTSIRTLFNSLL